MRLQNPSTTTGLRQRATPTAGGERPDLTERIAERAPDGTLIRSDALDEELDHEGWDVDGWLVESEDVLVLSARGQ